MYISDFIDEMILALAYPLFVWLSWVCGTSLLRWSSIYWCEQKREVLAVNRGTVTSLH